MKIYKVFPDVRVNPHCEGNIESAVQSVQTCLEEGGIGTTVMVKIIEMEKEKFDSLPEYEGP